MGCISVPHANVVTFWPCFRLDLDRPDPIFVFTFLRSASNAVSASHLKGVTREGKLMMQMDGDPTCGSWAVCCLLLHHYSWVANISPFRPPLFVVVFHNFPWRKFGSIFRYYLVSTYIYILFFMERREKYLQFR
jgi:hypothetical protein